MIPGKFIMIEQRGKGKIKQKKPWFNGNLHSGLLSMNEKWRGKWKEKENIGAANFVAFY